MLFRSALSVLDVTDVLATITPVNIEVLAVKVPVTIEVLACTRLTVAVPPELKVPATKLAAVNNVFAVKVFAVTEVLA